MLCDFFFLGGGGGGSEAFLLRFTGSRKSFIKESYSLDPDQAQHFVWLIWVQMVGKGHKRIPQKSPLVKKDLSASYLTVLAE